LLFQRVTPFIDCHSDSFTNFTLNRGLPQEEISPGFPRNPQLCSPFCPAHNITKGQCIQIQIVRGSLMASRIGSGRLVRLIIPLGAQSFVVLVPMANVDCCIFQVGSVSMVPQRFAEDPPLLRSLCHKNSSLHHRHVLCAPHSHNTTVSQMTQKLQQC
jgi:hypothetical protein